MWEYKIEKINESYLDTRERWLNRLGAEGWELILIEHGYIYTFKKLIEKKCNQAGFTSTDF